MGQGGSTSRGKILDKISPENKMMALTRKIAADREGEGMVNKVKDAAAQKLASRFTRK